MNRLLSWQGVTTADADPTPGMRQMQERWLLVDPIAELTGRIADGGPAGALFGFAVGMLLGLSPVSLPSVPVVVSALSPGQLDAAGARRLRPVFDHPTMAR